MSDPFICTEPPQIVTSFRLKPIPTNRFDWIAWVDGQEEDGKWGHGATEAEAIKDLQTQLEEESL